MRFPFTKPYLKRTIRLLLWSIGLYVLACAALVFGERHVLYQPGRGPLTPAEAGLTGFSDALLTAKDSAAIPCWEHATPTGPIILYMHGNAGGLYAFTPYLKALADRDLHVIAMEYRGFPGAPGKPTEKAIVADAITLFDVTQKRYPGRPIVIWGYSLGSGVATQLAAARHPAALVLEAPFSATVDLAARYYPLFPVKRLMRDQFLSREHIANIRAPLLILHGTDDGIVPMSSGEALFERATDPKEFLRYPGFHHLDLIDSTAYDDAVAFISKHTN